MSIIEPFSGRRDLVKNLKNKNIEEYDINPKFDNITKQDTLLNPPNYTNKFIITNPPYLARNKSKDKTLFDKYKVNDLYKCFIKSIINDAPIGGIIIIPLNFFCSIRKEDINLRKEFLNKFQIERLNIFEEQVFEDTSYSVCSFKFMIGKSKNKIKIIIHPSKKKLKCSLSNKNNYLIGGHIYNLSGKYKISRLTRDTKNMHKSNLLIKCIDDKEKINLSYSNNIVVDNTPNLSNRTYATLCFNIELTELQQKNLVIKFNNFLNEYRNKYNSLFLCNYRENRRKRISFDLVYNIVNYLLSN